MSRLIDADSLMRDNTWEWFDEYGNFTWAGKAVMDAPVIDAVEVVRCKYCKRFDPDTGLVGLGICEIYEGVTAEYGFCHHGKRKDGEQDDTIR